MDQSLRSALFTGFVTFATVTWIGLFLGNEVGASMITGALAGGALGLLTRAASRRAGRLREQTPPPVEPGFPGPPEPADELDADAPAADEPAGDDPDASGGASR